MAWQERFSNVGRRIGLSGTTPPTAASSRDEVEPSSGDTDNDDGGGATQNLPAPTAEETPPGDEAVPETGEEGVPTGDDTVAESTDGVLEGGDDEWLRWALVTYPQPEYPLDEDWSVSIAALLAKIPKFPRFAVRLLGLLDRFGAIHIGTQRIGFDGSELDWDRVTEIRLHNPADLLTEHVLEEELKRLLWIVPPVPGRRWLLRRVGRIVLTMYLIVEGGTQELLGAKASDEGAEDASDGLPPGVPAEIVYRRRLLGETSHEAGLVSVLLLALMPQTKVVLHQIAQERGIPFVSAEREGTLTAAADNAEAVRGRVGGVWRRWSRKVTEDTGRIEAPLDPHELEPATEGETREALASRPATGSGGAPGDEAPTPTRS